MCAQRTPDCSGFHIFQMLVHFFSDRNYVLPGFEAVYYVYDCPHNCSNNGRCINNHCNCNQGFTGIFCEQTQCPNMCGQFGQCTSSYVCQCTDGHFGYDCRLAVNRTASQSGWQLLEPFEGSVFTARTGLAGAFVSQLNRLYVFGGYSLNSVLGDLVYYSMVDEKWIKTPTTLAKFSPRPRYGHAMVAIGLKLYMFGGISLDGGPTKSSNISNELWMWNTLSEIWTLLTRSCSVQPFGVTGHTLTVVDDYFLYLFGGRTNDGTFLSKMFIYDTRNSSSCWQPIVARGGRDAYHQLVGHTAVFHRESRSILVFGGFMADSAKFPKRTNAMLAFNVDSQWWSELGNSLQVPRERAYHQAAILGNYMVIHGGNVHMHRDEEMCYDSQIYFYHLGCHVWVDGTEMAKALPG